MSTESRDYTEGRMPEARIIYVTGMKPKPDPVPHRRELLRVLTAAMARIAPDAADWLGSREERFVLVSWARLLYAETRDIGLYLPGIEQLLREPVASLADRREADALGRKLRRALHLIGDAFPGFSALVTPATLRVTLGEVTQYVGNRDGVAEDIRELLRREIRAAWAAGDRVLVVGHSFGSVIAYDTLWQLSRQSRDPGRIELFLTLGSPLATRVIRKGLKGADRGGGERYPANIDRWVNVSAHGEMVALHRRVRPFFSEMLKLGLIETIEDELIYNHFRGTRGLDVHRSYGYLNHPAVAGRICRWLGYSS